MRHHRSDYRILLVILAGLAIGVGLGPRPASSQIIGGGGAQGGGSGSVVNLSTNPLLESAPNDGTTGTTAGLLVKYTAANPSTVVTLGTSDTLAAAGICFATTGFACGTTGSAAIAVGGQVPCTFDGNTTAGDLVIVSTTTGGNCHDSGIAASGTPPANVQVIGIVLANGTGAGSRTVDLNQTGIMGVISGQVKNLACANLTNAACVNVANTFTSNQTLSASALRYSGSNVACSSFGATNPAVVRAGTNEIDVCGSTAVSNFLAGFANTQATFPGSMRVQGGSAGAFLVWEDSSGCCLGFEGNSGAGSFYGGNQTTIFTNPDGANVNNTDAAGANLGWGIGNFTTNTAGTRGVIGTINYGTTNGTNAGFTAARSKSGSPGSHGAVASGDQIGFLAIVGDDGTNFQVSSEIIGLADTTVGSGHVPGRLTFSTQTTGGTLTEAMKIDSSQHVFLDSTTTGTNADFLCLSAGGQILLQSSACTISSMRFKDLRGEVGESEALSTIKGLAPVAFTMKDQETNPDPNAGRLQVGLTAENVAAIDPRCAVYEPDMRTPKSYRQECVIAMLVGAVQAQQREIEALKAGRR